ncbi:MAG TPA: gamma-glutamyltransferase [Thermoanaerobaculaceae bacterium]|nr:gamma-glutamyltransferase [Thermoanaerobaculaceae bacterium]HPS80052.1 gamma-glutamyltransferase [Thermoanaerobaculaceae bacterium]
MNQPPIHARSSRCLPGRYLVLAILLSTAWFVAAETPPVVAGGAVASAAPSATAAGIELLRAGGSATDAAVAVALALAVVHPQAGNLGGGGFAVVRMGGEVAALDFRETAPAAATRAMFLDASGTPRPDASLVGGLAVGVAGSPAGLFALHRRFGRLPWQQVVAPAIRLAEGFEVTDRLARELVAEKELLARFPGTAAVWLPGGVPPPAGSTMRLPRLAAVLRDYAARGPAALTEGPAAVAIAAAATASGGRLTVGDLAAYRPVWREPLRFRAFGWEIASMPLPSSGGIILAQTFGMLERRHWSRFPPASAERLHLLAEVWRRAFADRFLLGDPSTALAGPEQLLAPPWLDARAASIDLERATPSTSVRPWSQARPESAETTHLSVVDAAGDAVALTTTLNGSFGSGVLVPELQILLNNEMDDFATAPGRPNLYGLVQGEANAVGPGKRMLSSMSPTVAWRAGEVLALGSPGGSRIPTATAQVLLAVLVDGAPIQDAVARGRIHHQWQPDELLVEEATLDQATLTALERRGHRVALRPRLGEVHAVSRDAQGHLESGADPRGPGAGSVLPSLARSAAGGPPSTGPVGRLE